MLLPSLNGINVFPSDDLPRAKKKEKEFGQQVATAVYSCLLQSSCLFGIADYTTFSVNRAYGAGRQDTARLRTWYIGAVNSNTSTPAAIPPRFDINGTDMFNPLTTGGGDLVRGARAFSPMDYTVVSPMPKALSIVESQVINEANYKIECQSVNPSHTAQRNQTAWTEYYRSTFSAPLGEQFGIKLPRNYFEPKNEAQLHLMLKNGYFRLLFESGFEDCIKQTMNISDFDSWNIKVVRDLCNLGFACGKRYCDLDSGATKIKYVDPAKFVIQWNDDRLGKNPSFVGHLSRMQMFTVKKMMQKLGYTNDQIVQVAKSNFDRTTQSADWPSTIWQDKDPITGRWLWEQLEVDVLEFEYVTQNELRYARDDRGMLNLIEEPNHRYDVKDIKTTVYEGIYLVGTQFLAEWKEAPNNDGNVSYFWAQVPGASLTERCIGMLDDLMKVVVKWRGEMWAAAPSGFYADLTAVANLALNPADQQEFIQQLVAAYRQSGILFGQSQYKNGRLINDKPIIPIDNGPKNVEAYANQMMVIQSQVLNLMGIPELLAATPHQSGEKAVGIGEIEVISAGHALWPIKRAYQEYMSFGADVSLRQIRLDIRFDEQGSRKYYEGVTGKEKMDAMLKVKDLSMDELAIELKALPNMKQKQQMKMVLYEASKSGTRDGLVKLTESDLMYCYRLIDNDQTELAEMFATMVIDERLEEYNNRQQETIKAQSEANTASAVAIEEARQKTLMLEIDLVTKQKERLIMLEKQTPSAEIAQKGVIEMEQIKLEGMVEAATGKDVKNPRNS